MARPAETTDEGQTSESRALTGLRGLAALLVVAHHVFLHLVPDEHVRLLQKGYLGVDLFFVLSGFVMSMVYGTWFAGGTSLAGTLHFLSRRFARLWPLHATLLVLLLLTWPEPFGKDPSPHLLAANFALVQAWGLSAALNPPAWSVSTEFAAYLLFPLLAGPVLRGRAGPWLAATAIAALLALALSVAPPIGPGRRGALDIYFNDSPLPLMRCLAGFLLGMLAWRLGTLPRFRTLAAAAWFGPTALTLFVALMVARSPDLVILAVLPALVLGMHHGTGPVQRTLGTGWPHRLGVLSYAIYLLHYALLHAVPWNAAPAWLLLPLYGAAVLAGAALLHLAIERPGRRLLRHLSARMIDAVLPPTRLPHGTRPHLQDETP